MTTTESLTESIAAVDPVRRRSRSRRAADSSRVPPWAAPVAFGACVVVWWIAAWVINDEVLLPSPLATIQTAVNLIQTPELWLNIAVSLQRVLLGWGIAIVLGVGTGLLMALWSPLRWFIDPIIEFTRPVPPLAYAPLLAVWFGIGELPKVLIIILSCYPVLVISTRSAVLDVDRDWVRAAQTLGAVKRQTVTRVLLPAALPQIMTAIRISSGLAWGTLVAAELIAADSGLGYMILQASTFLQTSTVLVGIILIGLLAFGTDLLLRLVERWVVPWRAHARAA